MKRQFRPAIRRRQKGVTLIIALVFLAVLTSLGLGMFLTTNSEEIMARNFRDKEIALQAAEAAINEAKMRITVSYDRNSPPDPVPSPLSCAIASSGFTCIPPPLSPPLDLFASGAPGVSLGAANSALSPAVTGLYSPPKYLIVKVKLDSCGTSNTGSCYQIFAQARGRLANTRVNLVELFSDLGQ